ncbi:MAG: SagB/ThcOx family dehydrogenase [Candidatus Marinimicrobia bacterium]|nr:SagB/ThcOx family dehydrogenase [Candidatus Neomarinimicrobiota bacterium]
MNRTIRVALTVLCFVFLISSRLISQTTYDIQLLPPAFKNNATLMQALQNRKSTRSYIEKELSLQQLSDLLWAANGVNREASGKRTAPTAHDEREIDVYVATAKGLYLYDADNHFLTLVLKEDIRALTGKQKFVKKAAVNLVFVADYDKIRGKRKSKDFCSATDTGFISQNVYLYCAAEGLATVVRGWVNRERLAKKMGLRKEQKIILAQTVGYAK